MQDQIWQNFSNFCSIFVHKRMISNISPDSWAIRHYICDNHAVNRNFLTAISLIFSKQVEMITPKRIDVTTIHNRVHSTHTRYNLYHLQLYETFHIKMFSTCTRKQIPYQEKLICFYDDKNTALYLG